MKRFISEKRNFRGRGNRGKPYHASAHHTPASGDDTSAALTADEDDDDDPNSAANMCLAYCEMEHDQKYEKFCAAMEEAEKEAGVDGEEEEEEEEKENLYPVRMWVNP